MLSRKTPLSALKPLPARVVCVVVAFLAATAGLAAAPALDPKLKPEEPASPKDELGVFEDMGVVQRKAMNKAKRFLFSSYVGMDFSDGPYSMYAVNTNIGYAFSDFLELYVNFAPAFINRERSIVSRLEEENVTLAAALPERQYGLELLWAPLYGKDSLGIRRIVRSDTFLKLGVSQIKYDSGNGMKYHLGVGKTYFLSKYFGLRATVSGNRMDVILGGQKQAQNTLILETGFVFYMF